MNRNDGSKIAPENLTQGDVYRFFSRSLGTANLKFLGGNKFRVVDGFLQSPKDKKKRWNENSELTLALNIGDFYVLNEPGEAE